MRRKSISSSVNRADVAGLDVEHADDRVVPDQRHGQHPGERLHIEAADPAEPIVPGDVVDGDRLAGLGHAAGDALARRPG